jgi:hypothetical protein
VGHDDSVTATTAEKSSALSAQERDRLERCEAVVERGRDTFVAVGRALAEIHEARLYRATHRNFATYLRERWGLSRPRAYELIQSSRIAEAIEANGDPPAPSEAAVRPLASIASNDGPEAAAQAWREITKQHNGNGPMTAADVRAGLADAGRAVGSAAVRNEPLYSAGRLLLQAGKYVERLEQTGLEESQRRVAGTYAARAYRLGEAFESLAAGGRRERHPDELCVGHGAVRDSAGVCVLCGRPDR